MMNNSLVESKDKLLESAQQYRSTLLSVQSTLTEGRSQSLIAVLEDVTFDLSLVDTTVRDESSVVRERNRLSNIYWKLQRGTEFLNSHLPR